jgi:hypothetical protein
MARVVFRTPGEMNLLGYILRSLVERNLNTQKGARALSKMKGTVLVGASRMTVTLDFSGEDLEMQVGGQGPQGKPDVRVRGSMDALLGVSLGKGMIWPVMTRRLKVGGKVWRLLRMLPLLKAEGA